MCSTPPLHHLAVSLLLWVWLIPSDLSHDLWAWPMRSCDRSCGISHAPTPAPSSGHHGVIVPKTPYSLSHQVIRLFHLKQILCNFYATSDNIIPLYCIIMPIKSTLCNKIYFHLPYYVFCNVTI